MQLLTVTLTDQSVCCSVLNSKAAMASKKLVKPAYHCLSPTRINKLDDPLPTLAEGHKLSSIFGIHYPYC